MIIRTWILLSLATLAAAAPAKWRQSYDAGYFDAQGKWAGGSEIMHLAAHAKSLYAANGYWLDARWVIPPEGQKQSAQVLRLDKADGKWQVDLDLGKANDLGLEYMKGNILKSVSFSTTGEGRALNVSKHLLVMRPGRILSAAVQCPSGCAMMSPAHGITPLCDTAPMPAASAGYRATCKCIATA